MFVFNTIDLVPSAWYTGGIFRVSKSAWNGLKSLSGTGLNQKTNVCLDPTLTVCFQYYRLGPECMVHGGIFRVSKSAWNGLKSLSGTCFNPKTNVCQDPTLTVCFQYYRLAPECMVHGGHLPGV